MSEQAESSGESASGELSARRYPVPPILGRSTGGFAPSVGATLLAWVVVWPFLTLGYLNRYDSPEAAWVQGLYLHKELLLRKAPEAQHAAGEAGAGRIVIVGGSGALFGVDAELIEKSVGVPTVNAATHGSLGAYLLHRARAEVRPGDAVLLCPEYEVWSQPGGEFTDLAWRYVCTYDKAYLWSLGAGPALRTLYSQPGDAYWAATRGWWLRLSGRLPYPGGPYNLATLDAWGDLRGPVARRPFVAPSRMAMPDPADTADTASAVPEFREFASWARANHVRLFYSWPNLCQPQLARGDGGRQDSAAGANTGAAAGAPGPADPRAVAAMDALLDQLGFVRLNEPGETVYPKEWFLDTFYHLDPGGRRVRTEALAGRLRPYFVRQPAPAPAPARPAAASPSPGVSPGMSPGTGPTRGAGVYLVTGGGPCRWWPAGTLGGGADVRARYLVTRPTGRPDAITLDELAVLAARGVTTWFDDPAVRALLPPDRWDADVVSSRSDSLRSWVARYDHHLFVLAQVKGGPGMGRVPPALPGELAGAGPVVAIAGTGRWAKARRVCVDSHAPPRDLLLEEDSAALTGASAPGLLLTARADPNGVRGDAYGAGPDPQARVQVNGRTFAVAPAGQTAVAVIDPDLGILVDCGTFAAEEEKVVWTLWRLSPKRPADAPPAR